MRGSCMSIIQSNKELQTQTATDGRDPDKIKERWLGNGRCICQVKGKPMAAPCHRGADLEDVQKLSIAMWSCPAEERAVLMSSLYASAAGTPAQHIDGEPKRTRVDWYVGHHRVCKRNLAHLLRMSPDTINDLCGLAPPGGKLAASRGCPELRQKPGPKQTGPKTRSVDSFFTELWDGAGPSQKPPVTL